MFSFFFSFFLEGRVSWPTHVLLVFMKAICLPNRHKNNVDASPFFSFFFLHFCLYFWPNNPKLSAVFTLGLQVIAQAARSERRRPCPPSPHGCLLRLLQRACVAEA